MSVLSDTLNLGSRSENSYVNLKLNVVDISTDTRKGKDKFTFFNHNLLELGSQATGAMS